MRIAIIGAGISGLTAAYRLHHRHQLTLFEAGDWIGGHTHTVEVEWRGERHAIDTGFIVFNNRTYPNFIALLDELGVASQPTNMGFSLRDDASGLEYNGSSLNGLFAQRGNLFRPSFHRLWTDILKFNRVAVAWAGQTDPDETVTVGQFLRQHQFSREFTNYYLLPMASAIWSCPLGTIAEFPVRFIVEFYHQHGLLSLWNRPTWRVIQGGSRTYVAALIREFADRIRSRTPIVRVVRRPDGVEVTPKAGPVETFDHVILACHADQALRMLGDAGPIEREVLSAFRYERNLAVLHTDPRVLPSRRRAWASWNYRIPQRTSDDAALAPAIITYQMNLLQGIRSPHVFNVTLNDEDHIDPNSVLSRIEYHHPVFTIGRRAAQTRHAELINVNRTSYCGAYWRNGFHEDGVVSALRVCEALGVRVPLAAKAA